MFSKPKYGWSTVTINEHIIGSASYIDDVPIYTLQTLLEYLRGETTHFELSYDAEGSYFGICEIMGMLYAFSDDEKMEIVCPLDPHYEDNDVMETVRKLGEEIYHDFTAEKDAWLQFYVDNCLIDDEPTDEYKSCFENLMTELRTLLDKPYHSMELGNLMFGNSRGEFCIPRDEWQNAFANFLSTCGFDSYGHIEDEELEKLYLTTEYASQSKPTNDEAYTDHIHLFDNNVFTLRPYYWGENDELAGKPNFVYKPENLEICWYKYPLRDAYSNKQLTFENFCDILRKCASSLQKSLHI